MLQYSVAGVLEQWKEGYEYGWVKVCDVPRITPLAEIPPAERAEPEGGEACANCTHSRAEHREPALIDNRECLYSTCPCGRWMPVQPVPASVERGEARSLDTNCEACDGTGEVVNRGTETLSDCPDCGGSGVFAAELVARFDFLWNDEFDDYVLTRNERGGLVLHADHAAAIEQARADALRDAMVAVKALYAGEFNQDLGSTSRTWHEEGLGNALNAIADLGGGS